MKLKNFLEDSPKGSTEEIIEDIISGNHFRMERIISKGQASPEGVWYDQGQNEWVLVLKGRGGLMFEGTKDTIEMNPGDYIHIPAHRRHRVAWTDPTQETIWLAIHYEDR
jgi:cupin 2 domain-containing protein